MGFWEDLWGATGGTALDRAGYGDRPAPRGGGGAGRRTRGSSLEAINEALQAQNAGGGNWWDRATGFVGDAFSGEWVPDPWEDAWDATGGRALTALGDAGQDIWAGDVSGALGDLFGGAYDIGRDAVLWGGQELGELGADFGQNVYSNWGLEDLLQAAGGVAQDLPGYGLDALGYLGDQAANVGKWGGSQLLDLGQAGWDRMDDLGRYLGSEVGDFVTQQAIPYFQQDFLEDVTNLAQGVADWTTDSAVPWLQQEIYDPYLKPAGLAVADWTTESAVPWLQQEVYDPYLKPAGLAAADWATDTAYPWLRDEALPYITDDLRHDVSDALEMIPAGLRGLFPEGSRLDDWTEAGVGGVGGAFDWLTEDVPGSAADLAGRGYNYLFDPSQPAFRQGPGKAEGAALQAVIEQIIANSGGVGGTAGGVGGTAGGAPSGVATPGTGANVAGAPMAYPGAAGLSAAPAGVGAPSTLDDLYSTLYGDMRAAAGEMYDVGAAGALASGELGRAYADEIRAQGAAAASAAEAAAQQYYTQGTDEAARAYNETIGALNTREQELLSKYTELETMQAGGISGDASEQRRVTEEIAGLQQARNDLRHQMVTGQLDAEALRGAGRLAEFGATRGAQLAADEAALAQQMGAMETERVGQEAAMAEQLASRFSTARAGMQQRIDDAEATLRAKGIEPAAYTAAPGAETQALLTSQELSMQTLQNRLRDASAAQAIDRQMRGREIYSAAGRALEDNLFAMRAELEESIATRRDTAALERFDAQADTDIAKAAALGEINLEEMTRLQASKEAIFGKRTDLFDQSELERITTRKEYNAALERERNEQRRAMEMAQQQRIIADAAAAERTFLADQARLDRENDALLARLGTETEIDTDETLTAIERAESILANEARLAEEFINVSVNGVDIPVRRDWYIEEHLIGPGEGADLASDLNLMQMQDDAGNMFYVDVGGVSAEGLPYLTQSAATNPQLTGQVLTPIYADQLSPEELEAGTAWQQQAAEDVTFESALGSGLISGEQALENLDALVGEAGASDIRNFLASLG